MINFASISSKICRAITTIGGCVLTANVVLIIVNILLRRFFSSPIYGSTEYVQYISLIVGAFGLCQNEWYGGNVTMTILHEKLSQKKADAVRFICGIISSIGFVYVSYLMTNDVFVKMAKNDVTNTLAMPRWIFVAILAFGIIMLTLAIIVKTIIQGYIAFGGQSIDLKNPKSTDPEAAILEIS